MRERKKVVVKDGKAVCPKCGAQLCKLDYGAYGYGIELWCRKKGCKMPVLIDIEK